MRFKCGLNNGTRKCAWVSVLFSGGWVLIGVHFRWRLAAFLPLPSRPVNRVYVGPIEIEWPADCAA